MLVNSVERNNVRTKDLLEKPVIYSLWYPINKSPLPAKKVSQVSGALCMFPDDSAHVQQAGTGAIQVKQN